MRVITLDKAGFTSKWVEKKDYYEFVINRLDEISRLDEVAKNPFLTQEQMASINFMINRAKQVLQNAEP